ncbi:kinesin, partial [Paraburkholderia aspalathi]|nr:kinesin [Paraburkholderia aspalathi]
MAPKTKAQKIDLEVEQALEQALEIDFGDDLDLDMDLGAVDDSFSLDDLEEQISRAAEELANEQQVTAPVAAASGANQMSTASTPTSAAATSSVIAAPPPPPAPPVVNAAIAPAPSAAQAASTQPSAAQSVTAPANQPRAAGLKPANDDLRSEGFASPRRATDRSSKIFWTTTALSALWAAGGLAVARSISPEGLATIQSAKEFFTSAAGLGVATGIAVPIVMFWGFAQLVRRAQEMQTAARYMTEAALRLAEPEAMAGDRVSTLSQAVRREVAAMNEGIERTLARAVELETLVQSEVNELERAYT